MISMQACLAALLLLLCVAGPTPTMAARRQLTSTPETAAAAASVEAAPAVAAQGRQTVQRAAAIALASGGASTPAPDGQPRNFTAAAVAAGIPVDTMLVRKHPQIARQVPLGAPATDGSILHFDTAFPARNVSVTTGGNSFSICHMILHLALVHSALSAALDRSKTRVCDIIIMCDSLDHTQMMREQKPSPSGVFVIRRGGVGCQHPGGVNAFQPHRGERAFLENSGRNFTLNGKPFFIGGTSWYDALVVSSSVSQ